MTAAEAVRRYHAAESRLAEVEKLIEAWANLWEWKGLPWLKRDLAPEPPTPDEPLDALLLEREKLQAESFKVFTEARRLG